MAASAEAPEWIELLPAGDKIIGADGRGFTNPDPQAVIDASMNAARAIPIDWEHSTERVGWMGGTAPAAAWVEKMELRNGEIWGNSAWNPRGKESVESREYRYVSPAFTHKDSQVLAIVSVGLTNRPNLDLTALNSTVQPTEIEVMTPEQLAVLVASLGLQAGATPEQVTVALNSAIAERDRLKAATPSLDLYVPRADYDTACNRAATAEAETEERKAAEHKSQVDAAINAALESGKITPATVEFYRQGCEQDGGLERFNAFATAAPEIAKPNAAPGGAPDANGAKSLNATEREVAESMGLTDEEYADGAEDSHGRLSPEPTTPAAA